MRRNTTQSEFRQLMQSAREKIDGVRITSDVIVGFPGETDEEFAISEAFIQEMDFAGLHVDDIPQFSEAFLTSSSRGIIPVVEIDGIVIGDGQVGAKTKALRQAYQT